MIEIMEKGPHHPYGNLVTKTLEEVGYNLEDEEFKEETTIIGTFAIRSMQYEPKDGKIIEKAPSNENKIKSKTQEIPIEIESSNNSLQILTTKDLLKIISGKTNIINDKIHLIVLHFIPDQTKLPYDMFFYYDLDVE